MAREAGGWHQPDPKKGVAAHASPHGGFGAAENAEEKLAKPYLYRQGNPSRRIARLWMR